MSDVTEYQQVAAITCMDIDILARIAESDQWTIEELRGHIAHLKSQKDLLITDAKVREMRYTAISKIFNVASKK